MNKLTCLAATLLCIAPAVLAQTGLFTTSNDFSGWIGEGGFTPTATTNIDLDGSFINGLGNTSAAGGIGSPGSLCLSLVQGPNGNAEALSPNEAANSGFIFAMANAKTVTLTYETVPPSSGDPLQLYLAFRGVFGNPAGIYAYPPIETSVSGDVTTVTYNAQGIVNLSPVSSLQIGVLTFSPFNPAVNPIYLDDLSIQFIPEPSAASLLGLGAVSLLLIRRRNLTRRGCELSAKAFQIRTLPLFAVI
jgi:hypothetical protein